MYNLPASVLKLSLVVQVKPLAHQQSRYCPPYSVDRYDSEDVKTIVLVLFVGTSVGDVLISLQLTFDPPADDIAVHPVLGSPPIRASPRPRTAAALPQVSNTMNESPSERPAP